MEYLNSLTRFCSSKVLKYLISLTSSGKSIESSKNVTIDWLELDSS